jgi:uncharacterized damage-inducible protein DinB
MRSGIRRRRTAAWLVALGAAWFALQAFADGPRKMNGIESLQRAWNEIARKLTAMAEDFPEEKYDYKATPAQRSFAEQLLHVAGSNDLFTSVARGKKPVDDEERAHFKTKAAVVGYLKKSFADGAAVIQEKGEQAMAGLVTDSESGARLPLSALADELIEHSAEHYGQLVVYYRLSGLVPPESRPKK